jgi:hypothetical protein
LDHCGNKRANFPSLWCLLYAFYDVGQGNRSFFTFNDLAPRDQVSNAYATACAFSKSSRILREYVGILSGALRPSSR